MQPDVLYALFAKAVKFNPSFKGIQTAYVSNNFKEAAAEVILKQDPPSTYFTFSPYWSKALAYLARSIVNRNLNQLPENAFIIIGFRSVEQTVDCEPGKRYITYTRISQ
jgi:zearalenone synthase (nonreducing iterative type I polyketide synthase)